MTTQLIAEIGWNHMGNMMLAEKMIQAASKAGAHYAKFQTWSVRRLKSGAWDADGRRQIYENAELSKDDHLLLIQYCNNASIKFLSSVFSLEDAKFLNEIGVRDVKIPSFECRNHELIKYCDATFNRIFMSSGTSMWKELTESVSLFTGSKLSLMHCVSSYPCNPEIANIQKLKSLKRICDSVGYSDHIMGVESAKVALEYDIDVIEKHFTIDRSLPGRDNKFAILPSDLRDLSMYIDLRDKMRIDHGLDYQKCEVDSRNNYTGRFNE